MTDNTRRNLALILALLSILFLLSVIANAAQWKAVTRGIPQELPGPNPYASISPYGINVDMLDWSQEAQKTALKQIADLGFKWIKQPVPWGRANGFDILLENAESLGLNVVPLLDGNPDDNYAPPDDPREFGAWAGEFAAEYGYRIRFYQIWDEPNLGSHWGWQPVEPAAYAALLAAAHDAIIAADPGAVIVAAALAPTLESGSDNMSDVDYLDALYELGADVYFDIASGKPYGFDAGPYDRRVSRDVLNFSRLVLLREVMERHGDRESAVWAGNFGWAAMPEGWTGQPSIWGQTDEATQAAYTREAYRRAIDEWPWAGVLFLENYAPSASSGDAPSASADDARWGFAISTPGGELRQTSLLPESPYTGYPIPNYQTPSPDVQQYTGGWRFQPEFGADLSQSGDEVEVAFEGTDFGLRVRRGDYRAYFYITVDGKPANELPVDDRGAYLCLTSPDRTQDDVVTIPAASNLEPGRHTARIVAERGWDQWALVGFSSANLLDEGPFQRTAAGLVIAALMLAAAACWVGRGANWFGWPGGLRAVFGRLGRVGQTVVMAVVTALFALSGWLAWLQPASGPLRRLGEEPQIMMVAAVAALYYFSPWLILNLVSGLALLLLICWRIDLGLALVALCAPFYVFPKPLMGYRFSMVEVVALMVAVSCLLNLLADLRKRYAGDKASLSVLVSRVRSALSPMDYPVLALALAAVLSLFFTQRLDTATNELRVVVIEPALFYLALRVARLDRRGVWRVVDGFVLGGLVVAILGLVWYAAGSHVITAEGGLPRLRSIYGSPNNVGLYLGRVIPILLAVGLAGKGRRRWLYAAALLPGLAAVGLSFSKGALLLGLPVGMGIVLAWFSTKKWGGRTTALLLAGLVVLALCGLLIGSKIPALAGRFSLDGATTDFRVSLWKASWEMVKDHPITGIGLDNFLYQYRGRYIRPEAWQEPDLSHPHNIVLDFWTRLGLPGLLVMVWLQIVFWRRIMPMVKRDCSDSILLAPLAAGLMGLMGASLAHGLVDQSFFLVDLAYAFMMAAALVGSGYTTERDTDQTD